MHPTNIYYSTTPLALSVLTMTPAELPVRWNGHLCLKSGYLPMSPFPQPDSELLLRVPRSLLWLVLRHEEVYQSSRLQVSFTKVYFFQSQYHHYSAVGSAISLIFHGNRIKFSSDTRVFLSAIILPEFFAIFICWSYRQ